MTPLEAVTREILQANVQRTQSSYAHARWTVTMQAIAWRRSMTQADLDKLASDVDWMQTKQEEYNQASSALSEWEQQQ